MMVTLLLPGTVIVYYGSEIGMSDPKLPFTCEETQDPYALPPYAECDGDDDLAWRSRDPGRTPMQWTSGEFAGFVNESVPLGPFYEPWLPVNPNKLYVNADYEEHHADDDDESDLHLFRDLMDLRKYDVFVNGDVYYPYHDQHIFSYMRWANVRKKKVEDRVNGMSLSKNE